MLNSTDLEPFELLRRARAPGGTRPWLKWTAVAVMAVAAVAFSSWRTWVAERDAAVLAAQAAADEQAAGLAAQRSAAMAEEQLRIDGHELLNRRMDELEVCHPERAQVVNFNVDLERLEGHVEIHMARVQDWPAWLTCLNSRPTRFGPWRVENLQVEDAPPAKVVRVRAKFQRESRNGHSPQATTRP